MVMTKPADVKRYWRRLAIGIFTLVPREARRKLDAVLNDRVAEFVMQTGVKTIMGFAPMPDEADLSPFFRRWLAEGGELALPVWLGGESMLVRRVTDLDTDLRPGRRGILEPLESLPEVGPDELELVITPGRVFSESCGRMGRGSGCYDALFRSGAMAKVGVAYDFQIFPEVPTDDRDVFLDMIITPSRIVNADA